MDFEKQVRTSRRSAELYKEIASTGTISSEMARRYAPELLDTLVVVEKTNVKQALRRIPLVQHV